MYVSVNSAAFVITVNIPGQSLRRDQRRLVHKSCNPTALMDQPPFHMPEDRYLQLSLVYHFFCVQVRDFFVHRRKELYDKVRVIGRVCFFKFPSETHVKGSSRYALSHE